MSKKIISPVITLGHKASAKLTEVLSKDPTEQQQKSFSQSIGVFSLYHKKWQEQKKKK